MDSLRLMVVFKCLMVWISVCGDMATSFVFPLFASHLLIQFVGELLLLEGLAFGHFCLYKAIILWFPSLINFCNKNTFTTLLISF